MRIGASRTTDYRKAYAGYSTADNSRTDDFYDDLLFASEKSDSAEAEKASETDAGKEDLWAVFHGKVSEMAEKLENGETEPSFQIGGQSFTEKEWNRLIDKIDKYIEQVRAEQAERVEKQKEEKFEKERKLKKEQEYRLLTDANERAFNSYGPNAPEEVKKAWMDAAEKTGANGAGMAENGMLTHITAMAAERATRWLKGDADYDDILGDTVESAMAAAEKALNYLENPFYPTGARSPEVQKLVEKEKEFYQSFLENLKV